MLEYTEFNILELCDHLLHTKTTKMGLLSELSNIFHQRLRLENTTFESDKSFDYTYSCLIKGDSDRCDPTFWYRLDIYYLKARERGVIYITEIDLNNYVQ